MDRFEEVRQEINETRKIIIRNNIKIKKLLKL
jgi:hypothetical protein